MKKRSFTCLTLFICSMLFTACAAKTEENTRLAIIPQNDIPAELRAERENDGSTAVDEAPPRLLSLTEVEQLNQERAFLDPELFSKNHIIAYYGHPKSKIMGIIGRHPKEELVELLRKEAAEYDRVNGEKGVVCAFYIIYGTCQPHGNIGRMNPEMLESYINFCLENRMLIYIDHQIGKNAPRDAIAEILPYLKYPNVHLAIDVEWRTTRPMKEVGHITAAELNELQQIMRKYMIDNNIPGKRQLVFHQFNDRMVTQISQVKADYDPVMLIHSTSGWGKPSVKLSTHERNARVTNIPDKAFKLWYFYSDKKGVHYDKPLMTPEDVIALTPQPGLIIYQ